MYTSTKFLELGSCAFRQWRAADGRIDAGERAHRCSLLHGYRLTAKFTFGCQLLDDRNWCVDFGGLGGLKKTLKDQFDHTLCLAKDDPLIEIFQHLHNMGGCDLRIMDDVGIERTAEWCFKAASSVLRELYGDRCWVESVEVFEHEANSAVYSESKEITYNEMHPLEHAVTTEPVYTHQPQPAVSDHGPKPAAVGNKVTSGFSNLFAGTSWGN